MTLKQKFVSLEHAKLNMLVAHNDAMIFWTVCSVHPLTHHACVVSVLSSWYQQTTTMATLWAAFEMIYVGDICASGQHYTLLFGSLLIWTRLFLCSFWRDSPALECLWSDFSSLSYWLKGKEMLCLWEEDEQSTTLGFPNLQLGMVKIERMTMGMLLQTGLCIFHQRSSVLKVW